MDKNLQSLSSSADMLRHVALRAFPARAELKNLNFNEDIVDAWGMLARSVSLDEVELARQLAPHFGVEPAGPIEELASDVLAQLPAAFCQRNHILPLRFEGSTLVIATCDPYDQSLTELTRFLVNRPVRWVLAAPDYIETCSLIALAKEGSRQAHASDLVDKFGVTSATDENAIVKLGKAIFMSAIKQRASDLHIQPFLGAAVVRIRVDGVLRRVTILPDAVASTLIRHIKANSGMDSTNRMTPQDGRMSTFVDERNFDLRISVLPANNGERLVVRFLEQGRVSRLSGVGFSLAALQTLRRLIARPSGLVLLTGPTGCGKTSTLYAMLSELNQSSVNIITVEDPVEYQILGVSQVDVNDKAGRTFAAALRSILRQDPDVLLIGEIRDAETAEIAVQAAMTGHLVLSTLHTNDALTAIPRLLGLGLQPNALSESLTAIVAQRLCRTLCLKCRVPLTEPLTPEEKSFLEVTRNRPAYRAVGCPECAHTGYRGRLPIVDIVEVNGKLRNAVAEGEKRLSVLETLREGGLTSLAVSGSMRIISGETTVREVMHTVGPSFWTELARHFGTTTDVGEMDFSPRIDDRLPGVLVVSEDQELTSMLNTALASHGYRQVVAENREKVHERLLEDEEIVFIVGDIADSMTIADAVEWTRQNRARFQWARLPAVLLLPSAIADKAEYLRGTGALATMIEKPLKIDELIGHIRRSHAR